MRKFKSSIAKLGIILLLVLGFLYLPVEECSAKKKKKSKSSKKSEYLEDKSLFFGAVHGGMSLSQIDGDNFSGYNKVDANFSATGYIKLDDNIALSNEIGYNTKGSIARGKQLPWYNSNGEKIKSYAIKLGYAEFAFMGNYFDKRQNNVGVGLSYGRLVSSEEKANGTLLEDFPFEKNVLDMILNGEVRILSDIDLFLNLRFQYSILPARKNYSGFYGRPEQINKQFLVRLGYLF